MNKLIKDVLKIGSWISKCQTEEQVRNLVGLYETVISKQFHPEVDDDSISDTLGHLDEMVNVQITEITKHYAGNNSQLQENISGRDSIY